MQGERDVTGIRSNSGENQVCLKEDASSYEKCNVGEDNEIVLFLPFIFDKPCVCVYARVCVCVRVSLFVCVRVCARNVVGEGREGS